MIVVLPIFNEALNLPRLLDRVEATFGKRSPVCRIVAVDDGSTDGTSEVLERFRAKMPLEVVRHPANQGLGMAIRTGLTAAMRLAAVDDIIVSMDADDTHDPELILKMLHTLDDGFDVVIASRFRPGSRCVGVPLYRNVLSVGASFLFRIVFPTPGVRDFTCGFRAYRASAIQRASQTYGSGLFEFDGFQSTVDLLLKLRKIGVHFAEAPIVLRYDQKRGLSKMRVFQTAIRTLGLMMRRRLGR